MIQTFISLGIIIGSIITGAVGDGLNDKGKKIWGHSLKAIEIGTLLMSPFMLTLEQRDWLAYLGSYVFIRAAIFDPIYNLAKGNKLSYIGNSSIYGKVLRAFKAPPQGYWFMRTIFFISGAATPFKFFWYA